MSFKVECIINGWLIVLSLVKKQGILENIEGQWRECGVRIC
jgi:hypothetical protein